MTRMDELLHTLRIKGLATPEAIAAVLGLPATEVAAGLERLAAEGFVLERASGKRPGWVILPAGREHHAAALAVAAAPAVSLLAHVYERFLGHNAPVKTLCVHWQRVTDDADRFELLEQLAELHEGALPVLAEAGTVLSRFGRYGERLTTALERAPDDPRFVVSPLVESYHQVWFECHEDFLLTLGRDRAEEGSF
jgi:predicted ArsR family transcriptional regulator